MINMVESQKLLAKILFDVQKIIWVKCSTLLQKKKGENMIF